MSNTKLFYSYKDTNNTGKVPLLPLSSYSDSIIFDEDNRRMWHNGKQYGNTYWGTKHGETFNDLDKNYAYDYAHAEGSYSYAAGESSHVEGISNSAYGKGAHVEGNNNVSYGYFSHNEGVENIAEGYGAHVEGNSNTASGLYSHAQGKNTVSVGTFSDAQGIFTTSYGYGSHSEGNLTYASYYYSHAEGESTSTYGDSSHAEGWLTSTKAAYSHAEGKLSYSTGSYSHSEGLMTETLGDGSHAEGKSTKAYGYYSHTEGNSTVSYGENSHSEGLRSTAFGASSHAEGEYSYAAGVGSHTQGLGTIAYNNYEAAFGQYNKSIDDGDNSTIYSIGDGKSDARRHNIIDFRQNGDMHKNGNSYFHDNIYGPVSYTYVSSLGDTATLDVVLSSLLTQPEYTRPNIKAQFRLSTGAFTPATSGNYTETVELGTYFYPEFKIVWPTRTQSNTSGTRAYDAVCEPSKPNYLLGYSYGVVPGESSSNPGICITYNDGGGFESTMPSACNKTLYAYALDTTYRGATTPCYILGETTYTVFSNLQVSYLQFSYMYFQQLYEKGVYVNAMGLPPKEWLSGGVSKLGSNYVTGKLKYFYGFSGDSFDSTNTGKNHPKDRNALRAQKSGWLYASNTSTELSIDTGEIGKTNASKYCLWIAYPDSDDSISNAIITNKHYKLVANSDKFKIEVLMKDGMNFDLVSPDQPLKSSYIDIYLGNSKYTTRYKIAYIDFQKPIGNVNNVLKFSIAPISNSKPALV